MVKNQLEFNKQRFKKIYNSHRKGVRMDDVDPLIAEAKKKQEEVFQCCKHKSYKQESRGGPC